MQKKSLKCGFFKKLNGFKIETTKQESFPSENKFGFYKIKVIRKVEYLPGTTYEYILRGYLHPVNSPGSEITDELIHNLPDIRDTRLGLYFLPIK